MVFSDVLVQTRDLNLRANPWGWQFSMDLGALTLGKRRWWEKLRKLRKPFRDVILVRGLVDSGCLPGQQDFFGGEANGPTFGTTKDMTGVAAFTMTSWIFMCGQRQPLRNLDCFGTVHAISCNSVSMLCLVMYWCIGFYGRCDVRAQGFMC